MNCSRCAAPKSATDMVARRNANVRVMVVVSLEVLGHELTSGVHWEQLGLTACDRQLLLPPHQPQPVLMLHSVQDKPKAAHTSREGGGAVTGGKVVADALVTGAVDGAAAVVAVFVVGAMTGQMVQDEGEQQGKKLVTASENKPKTPVSCRHIAPPPRENCVQPSR